MTRVALLTLCLSAVLAGPALLVFGQVPWPLPLRPSLVVLDDPDLRREVCLALLVLAGGLLVAGLGVVVRRLRWPSVLVAMTAVAYAAPHVRLLLVEAYPTSFYRSPTGFASDAITHGRQVFTGACVSCHGGEGRGDGPLARSLADPPADLTASHLWEHSDGEMFWWLTHGMDNPEGGLFMPGFAESLSPADRWDLIDYVRAHNAGVAMRTTGGWPHPVAVPGFVARCADGTAVASGDLRGRVVRLILAGGRETPKPLPPAEAGIGILDVYVPTKPDGVQGCVTDTPALVEALATVTGRQTDAMGGIQFLVDPQGFLRAQHRSGEPGGWSDTVTLLAKVGQICTRPVAANGGDDAEIR